jgi:hypothetical protein
LFKLDTANKIFLTSEDSAIKNGLREFFPELFVPDAYCIWCQIVNVKKDFEQGRPRLVDLLIPELSWKQ